MKKKVYEEKVDSLVAYLTGRELDFYVDIFMLDNGPTVMVKDYPTTKRLMLD